MASGNESLLALPNEILDAIVRLCHDPWRERVNERYTDVLAICLVCRRFRDVTLPILYETVLLQEEFFKNVAFMRQMHALPSLALLVKDMSLAANLSTVAESFEPPPPPPRAWPHEGPLSLQPFENLSRLVIDDAMLPLFLDRLPTEGASFPTLAECTFAYGLKDSTLLAKDFLVSNFMPFWSLPSLCRFTLGGRALRVTSQHTSNPPVVLTQSLLSVVELQIHCIIDKEALRELIQVRTPVCFAYTAPTLFEPEDNILDECFEFLAPCINELQYVWHKWESSDKSRYPNLSNYVGITKLSLEGSSVANFTDEFEEAHQPELLIAFPRFLKHLTISIRPQLYHRRQVYALITVLVQTVLSGLDSLELKLGAEFPSEEPPDELYWNNRQVSEEERDARAVPESELYGIGAETVEHINLRRICDQMNIVLRSNYLQMFPEEERANLVFD